MTVVNVETGEIVESISAEDARRLTTEAQNEFRSGVAHMARAWELVEEAVMGGGHIALGYRSPGDYLQAEFNGVLAGFNIAERRLAVRTMTGWGLSTRAIAPVVGTSREAVRRDVAALAGDTPVSPEPQTPAPEEGEAEGAGHTSESVATSATVTVDHAAAPHSGGTPTAGPVQAAERPTPTPIVGIDGKTYTRPEPKPRATPRRAITDQFFDAAYDTAKKVESLHRLIGDDRFPQNAEKVAAKHRNDLLRTRDLLEQVINALPTEESTRD